MLVLLPVVAVVALRNYWSGRIDRQTVTRVAAIIFVLGMFEYILSANHQWGQFRTHASLSRPRIERIPRRVLCLWYSGLEPLVRRIWPQTLITWTRAVAGQLRDPLVGRDLLVGTVFGLIHLLIVQLGVQQSRTGQASLTRPPRVARRILDGGARKSVRRAATPVGAVWNCGFCLALLPPCCDRRCGAKAWLSRLMERSLRCGAGDIPVRAARSGAWVIPALATGAAGSLNGFVIVRFGFLAYVVAWMTVAVLEFLPLTTALRASTTCWHARGAGSCRERGSAGICHDARWSAASNSCRCSGASRSITSAKSMESGSAVPSGRSGPPATCRDVRSCACAARTARRHPSGPRRWPSSRITHQGDS